MLHPVTLRSFALAACSGLFACNAFALALGQPRGAVLIGRPLEVLLPVTLDAPDNDKACSVAELFYGDTRVNTAPEIRWQPGPNGREGTLRIASPVPVDEPTVTLNLRVGCGANATSRRYVLLPDLPRTADPAPADPGRRPAAPPMVVAPIPAPTARAPAPAAAVPSPRAAQRRRTEAAAGPAPAPAAPRPTRGDSRRQAAAPAPAPASAPASRLRLAPLELGPERDAVLHFSTELTLPGAGDPAQRAAAAALWQALNKTPEEAMQDGLKLQALDREIQSLRQVTQQNAAAVAAMREQVQAARNDRNQASMLVLGLLALLLAFVGWVGWRWYQSRRLDGVSRWFEANTRDPRDSQDSLSGTQPPARQPAMPGGARSGPASVDPHVATAPLGAAAARAAGASGWPNSESQPGEFQASQGGTLRMVGVRELLDVHDKADFFLSIGQHEQAIAVLEAHVHDQVETSALPWLDLLELYHSLGRREQFEARRAEFRQRFTAQVPDFDHFNEPTGSLENYSRALSRIVALWPSRRVLEIIEESMFRKPGLPGADTFSLEAYRELVLLYHIAQEVAPPEQAEHAALAAPPIGFSSTSVQPLSELDRPESGLDVPLDLDDMSATHIVSLDSLPNPTIAWGDPKAAGRDPLYIPPASPRLGLDIDLTDLEEPAAGAVTPVAAPTPVGELTLELPERPRELPPLDFDTSQFEPGVGNEPPRRG